MAIPQSSLGRRETQSSDSDPVSRADAIVSQECQRGRVPEDPLPTPDPSEGGSGGLLD